MKKKNKYKNLSKEEVLKQQTRLTRKIILSLILFALLPFVYVNSDISFGPLDIFRQNLYHTEIILMGGKDNTEGAIKAIKEKNYKLLNFYIKTNIALDKPGLSGQTPICVAANNGDYRAVEILLLSPHINLLKKNSSDKFSPMFCAVRGGDVHIVESLVKAGLNFDYRDKDLYGISPIHYAASIGQHNILSYFVKNGVDINQIDLRGRTPLHFAVMQKNSIIIKILLNAGAQVNIKDNNGLTPIMLAKKLNKDYYVSLMQKYIIQN